MIYKLGHNWRNLAVTDFKNRRGDPIGASRGGALEASQHFGDRGFVSGQESAGIKRSNKRYRGMVSGFKDKAIVQSIKV